MSQKQYLSQEAVERLRAIPQNIGLPVLLFYVSPTESPVKPERMDEGHYRDYCGRCKEQLVPILREKRIRSKDIGSKLPMLSAELNPEQILDLDKNPLVEIQIDHPGILQPSSK